VEPGTSAESSVFPTEYEIEPEGVDPDFFFDPEPIDSEDYKIGPEDVLEIRVFELEQLNRTVRVLADGNINLPLIGLVAVQGLTSTQAAEQVAGKLQNRFVQNPQVSVLITEFNSRKVSLLGAVSRPATYPLVGRRNLLQIIADAGGLSADAGGILYVFRRLADGRSARLSVPLSELLIKGDPRWNIWLRTGDIVSIPPEEAITVSVLGAVRNPGIYKLPVGEDAALLRAIALAGGLTERGSKSGIQVKRRTGSGKETVIKVDLGKILSGDKPDVFLEEGDVILVKESFF
jgi:polysaccharide export outer membrane protein